MNLREVIGQNFNQVVGVFFALSIKELIKLYIIVMIYS